MNGFLLEPVRKNGRRDRHLCGFCQGFTDSDLALLWGWAPKPLWCPCRGHSWDLACAWCFATPLSLLECVGIHPHNGSKSLNHRATCKPLHGCALMLPGTLQVPECMQFWHVLGCSTLNDFFATCSRKAVSNASWEASAACQCIQPPWSESCRGCNSAFHICSRHDLSPSLVFSCTVFWQFTKNLWQAFAHKQCHCLT